MPEYAVAEEARSSDAAGWGQRFAAWLIDGLLTWIPLLVAAGTLGAVVGDPDAPGDTTDELAGGGIALLGLPLLILYHVLFRGRTPGKRALGIAVRDERTGEAIGFGRALGRALVTLVLWIAFYLPGLLDGLWPLWDRKKQSLHDKMVGTVVVRL